MKIRKFFTALFIASTVIISTASAADGPEVEDEGPIDIIINAGKQLWGTVKDKATEVAEDISDAFTSLTSKITVGEWIFENGKYSTSFLCEKNGNMTITQTNATGKIVYTGTFTSSVNKITFKVEKKSTKILFLTTSDKLDCTWEIDYSFPFAKEIKISSKDIPDDANGYDFSRPTIFTAVKADAK